MSKCQPEQWGDAHAAADRENEKEELESGQAKHRSKGHAHHGGAQRRSRRREARGADDGIGFDAYAGRVLGSTWQLLLSKLPATPNSYTIGIEHEGKPDMLWTDAMYEASATPLTFISQRWSIALDRMHVVRHAEIYSKKRYCPGAHCDLAYLIDLAQHVVFSGTTSSIVVRAGTVTTTRDLNIRLGAPRSLAERVRLLPKGPQPAYTGWPNTGQSVHGNAHWYRDADGNFFWAGGTSALVPTYRCCLTADFLKVF